MQLSSLYLVVVCMLSFAGCHQAKPSTSSALSLTPKTKKNMQTNTETITFGGGCYWCMEAVFQRLNGVENVASGFSGGQVKNPTYKEVCTGQTGHAEVIQIDYDTTKISLLQLLKVFFTMHDPTTLNRQGNDVGTQYRSVVFYRNEEQKEKITTLINALNEAEIYPSKIVTQVAPFTVFYKAEEDHQNYYNDNKEQGYCRFVIQPKIDKLEKVFKDLMKH